MSKLAVKTGNKALLSNNKSWLDYYYAVVQSGVGWIGLLSRHILLS